MHADRRPLALPVGRLDQHARHCIGAVFARQCGLLQEDGVIMFNGNKVSKIISLQDNTERTQYRLEPELS